MALARRCAPVSHQGRRLADIVRDLTIPAHLADRPYLQPVYDDPHFLVHTLWRHYAGWWYGKRRVSTPSHGCHVHDCNERTRWYKTMRGMGTPRPRDQNPAHLRIGHEAELAHEIVSMAGGPRPLVERARYLATQGTRCSVGRSEGAICSDLTRCELGAHGPPSPWRCRRWTGE